jgi:molybdopterin/thiamine biosynthesis adenylyltransferase
MIRLAMPEADVWRLEEHLAAAGPEEDGAFLLLREGAGATGTRLVAEELILPPPDGWERQSEGQLRPSARWFSAVISRALEADAGLLFVHSHPGAGHPACLSSIDEIAVESLGAAVTEILDAPFAATVVHRSGWAGVLWSEEALEPIGTITALGRGLRVISSSAPPREPQAESIDARQRDALGVVHERLRGLTVGLVGCGGLGSPIAEQLVRMGVAELVIVDDDILDTPSNVRRIFGSAAADLAAATAPAKVDVVGRHLDQLHLGTRVRRIRGDVTVEGDFRALLDTDIVIGATDTHSSRAVLNDLSSTYLLPAIDVGVRVGNRGDGALAGLVAELRLLTPERPCLWCRGSINADAIRAETMPADERRALEREGYLTGSFGAPVASVTALTVLGSGMATCALIGLVSSEAEVLPSGWILDGLYGDAFETAAEAPKADCRCRSQLAKADLSPPPLR